MRRREFIGLGFISAVVTPLLARAETAERKRRIGILFGSGEGDNQPVGGLAALRRSLQELGWTEGRDVEFDVRYGAADPDRIRELADELVGLRPDVILAHTTTVVEALRRETRTIPIVFVVVSDPVGSGFVASLAKPGGNITGFINIEDSLGGKWMEILKDIAPATRQAAILYNPATAPYFAYYVEPFDKAARALGVEPIVAPVQTAADVERVITELGSKPDSGLVLAPDVFTTTRSTLDLIVSTAARHRLPVIYPYRFMASAGGLLSYGIDPVDLYRQASLYIDRILKGANPADLPVQLPTKFELVVNLKVAKALGFTIPATLLGRADDVIE
jgi:putative ABC transport system substrate-binding protein